MSFPHRALSRIAHNLVLGACALVLLGILPILGVLIVQATVSEETLATWTRIALNRNLPGRFYIDRIAWHLPLQFEIHDAWVEDPNGMPAIRVDRIALHVEPLPLLHGHIEVPQVRVQHARVYVHQEANDPRVNLDYTFQEKPTVSADVPPMPVSLELADIAVENSRCDVDVPGARISFRNIDVQDSRLWLKDWTLGVDAQVLTRAIFRFGQSRLALPHVAIRTDDAQYHFAGLRRDVDAKLVAIQTDGLRLRAKGSMQATDATVEKFDTHYDLHFDAYHMAALPKFIREQLHGQADTHIDFTGSAAQQHFDIALQGRSLAAHDIMVNRINLSGHLNMPQVQLQDVDVRTSAGTLQASGNFNLTADGIGAHDLQVSVIDVPLRRLIDPYVNAGPVLPQRVQAQLNARGPGLWPLGSRVELHMIGAGIAASVLPGVPDPMELHGRVLLLSKGVRIEVLALQGEGVDFAVRGEVPWKPDSLVSVLTQFKRMPKGRTIKQLMLPLG